MADIESAKKAFERFDVDGDGFITAAEYKKVMAELGDPYVSATTAQAVIDAKDGNGDHVLSFEEFWTGLSG